MSKQPVDGEHVISVGLQFPPQISFVSKLSEIAVYVEKELGLKSWSTTTRQYTFHSEDNLFQLTVDHRSVQIRVRSLNSWSEHKKSCLSLLKQVLNSYGLDNADSLDYHQDSLLKMQMSYGEIASLGLQSMFNDPGSLVDNPNDWMLILVRDELKMELRFETGPLNQEMAKNHLKSVANVTTITDPVWGRNLVDLVSSIDGDRLLARLLAHYKKPARHDLERLIASAEEQAAKHIDRVVNKILNLA